MSPRAILAGAWCVFAIVAYPGLMADDSFALLASARGGESADPPLVAAIWWLLDRIVVGPFPMLALQSLALLAGAYLLARAVVTPRAAAVCAAAVLLAPPVLAGASIVGAHAQLAGLSMLGGGLVVSASPRVRIAGICVLALAAAVRDLAFAATLPLLIILLAQRLQPAGWRRYAIAGALGLATVIAACGANRLAAAPAAEVDVDVDLDLGRWSHTLGFGDTALPIVTRETQSIERLRAAEIQSAHGFVQRTTGRALAELSRSIVFWPWVYLALAVALLVRFRVVVPAALVASGVIHELALVTSTTVDWRDSLWLIATTLLAVAILIARRRYAVRD